MKRMLAWLLAALLLPAGVAMGEGYRMEERNTGNFVRLLNDMLSACETLDEGAMDADLEAIRAVSAGDYALACDIAGLWRETYLAPDFVYRLYDGGERATALEAAGLSGGDDHAFVVLGYALENGEMTGELKGRCDAAAAAARSCPGAAIICSGGATGDNNPLRHTEAGLMRDYLVDRCGIDAGRILIDEQAMTTAENALNTFEIMRAQGLATMTLVTSAYHMKRAQVLYGAVGALYARACGYRVGFLENYCLDIAPVNARLWNDADIAIRQLGQILGLPDGDLRK